MTEVTTLIDRYIDVWNETDAAARRALIRRTWSEQASYVDPMLEAQGHDAIDAMVASVHERFPGYRFSRTGAVEQHHDRVRFGWSLGPAGGPMLVTGTDFGVLSSDARLDSVTGFFDTQPGAG